MNRKFERRPRTSRLIIRRLLMLANYRVPMPVTELMVFPNCTGYPAYYVCPRCRITMEREYMNFCDRCGQRLDWHSCEHAKIVYPGPHR